MADLSVESSAPSNLTRPLTISSEADCTLTLHFSSSEDQLRQYAHQRDTGPGVEISVWSGVLCAKSRFFRALFHGQFLEGRSRNSIHITLEPGFEDTMQHLLHHAYFNTLSTRVTSDPLALRNLLLLADRFDIPDCVSAAALALRKLLPSLTADKCRDLLEVPDSVISCNPDVQHVLKAARTHLVKALGHTLLSPSSTEDLVGLPQSALLFLLESDDLESVAKSEDEVARAAWAWVEAKSEDEGNRVSLFCSLVVPRLRLECLSPHTLCWVFNQMAPLLRQSPRTRTAAAVSQGDSEGEDGVTVMDVSPQSVVEESVEALTCAMQRMCTRLTSLGGLIQPGAGTSGEATCAHCPVPKVVPGSRFSGPERSIFVDVSLRRCQEWIPSSGHLAVSAPLRLAGRWINLLLHVERGYLGAYVQCHGPISGKFSLDHAIGVQTPECVPAYRLASPKTRSVFSRAQHSWGSTNVLEEPWAVVLRSVEKYFVDESLRVRADLWSVET